MAKNFILSSLQQLNVREPKHKNLVSVSSEASLQEVLETLDEHDVFAVPVHKTKSDNAFLGIASRTDILTTFLFPHRGMNTNQIPKEQDFVWPKLDEPVSSVLRVSAETASGSSGLVPFVFQDSDLLPQLLEAFSSGFHRVLVQGSRHFRMVSQSDVAAFLLQNINHLDSLKNGKVLDFMSKQQVKALSPSLSTFAAFRELLIEEVSAAPVIDDDGKLIGTLSLYDSRGLIRQSSTKDLFLPVSQFVSQQGRCPSVVLEKTDTFVEALRQMVENHVYRAWVMENGKLVGAVSLTDVCTYVFTSALVTEQFGEYSRKKLNLLKTPLNVLVSDKKEASIVDYDTPQRDVLELLAKDGSSAVPVKDKDGLVGLASLFDIFSVLLLDNKLEEKIKIDIPAQEPASSQEVPVKELPSVKSKETVSNNDQAPTKSTAPACVCRKKSGRKGGVQAHTRRCRRIMLAAKSEKSSKPETSSKAASHWQPVARKLAVTRVVKRRSSVPTKKKVVRKAAARRSSVPAKTFSIKDTLLALWKETSEQTINKSIISPESATYLVFDENERLSKVLHAFAQGYHHVLISSLQDSEGYILLTQFDVVSYFHQIMGQLTDVAKRPASSVVSHEKLLKTVSAKESGISAFRTLMFNNLDAALVTDSNGEAIGTLSIADLRGLNSEGITDLLLPVEEFLKKRHGEISKVVIISENETFANIVDMVTSQHLDHIWIAGYDMKPMAMLSLTDIIKTVLLNRLEIE